jgi:hypothetical protein
MAAYHGRLKICDELVEHGFDVYKQIGDHCKDYNALSTTVCENHIDMMTLHIRSRSRS